MEDLEKLIRKTMSLKWENLISISGLLSAEHYLV